MEGRSLILLYIASAIGGKMFLMLGVIIYCLRYRWSNDVEGRSFILLTFASFPCILPPPSEVKRRRIHGGDLFYC